MKYNVKFFIILLLFLLNMMVFLNVVVEAKKSIVINFGEPVYATKTIDDYHMWAVDMYSTINLYDVKIHSITSDTNAHYIGNNVIGLSIKHVEKYP